MTLTMRSADRWRRAAAMWLCALCLASVAEVASGQPAQRSFRSAEEAAKALIQALQTYDRSSVLAILGQGASRWMSSGDAVADRAARERFVTAFEQKHVVSPDGESRATLLVGPDDWPFAFPLVKSEGRWRFDTNAGRQELLARRIGENELAVINVMLAIVDAQREYAQDDHDGDGVPQYARKLASSPGKQDGLYWPTASGKPPSPLGPLVAQAVGEGYRLEKEAPSAQPYHGYHFRVLTSQGPHAGGAMDYIVKGRMIGGFAALAYPARYGNSGVMTFIVNHDGVVYERDLGPETIKKAQSITRFDPGPGWSVVTAPR